MTDIIRDMARGPMDVYRKKATFDWKSLKLHLEGEKNIESQVRNFSHKHMLITGHVQSAGRPRECLGQTR